ncbi:hypothetical protein NMG60_11034574 [Bertholletia excelsa]
MKKSVHDEELAAVDGIPNPCHIDGVDEEVIGVDVLETNDSSIFYNDFPALPDFPCVSSSSSSSSTAAPAKQFASLTSSSSTASSSAASWAVLKSDAEEDVENKIHHAHVDAPPLDMGGLDCIDVMDNFGYMDLIDPNDIWDPSSIFQSENFQELQLDQKPNTEQESQMQEQRPLDELGVMFFEWLKSNKEYISAEDMRSIKLKRSTVDCASKRLGSTKEGKKQLLKLILEWVEQYQLQKTRVTETTSQLQMAEPNFQSPNPNPNLSCNAIPHDTNPCFSPTSWMPPPPPPPAVMMAAPASFPPPPSMVGYMDDPYSCSNPTYPNYHHPTEYSMIDSTHTWPSPQYGVACQYSPYPDNNITNMPVSATHCQAVAGYGNQYMYQYYQGGSDKLVRLGSNATKEARKKRMARQRRLLSHHHRHHHHHHNQQKVHQNQSSEQHIKLGSENCTSAGLGNWVYWPGAGAPPGSTAPVVAAEHPLATADRPSMQTVAQIQQQRQSSSDRRQAWKPEKNLKFLLQKVLKQSDVGNLGRIVLPKKEAETHLPELEVRDGISIAMEDIGTSRVWNMRYRFWPNNKSRMYLLENTGDFIRANGLQEGDFIVLYSDVKCGKYLIRGVKVPQPGAKSEAKKPVKSHRSLRVPSPLTGNGSALHQATQ